MGAVTGEKGVLKLVHPGRFVEMHRESITAAEVMKKNPRHSVTRTDFFEYPWIVVKPESILNLGRVFYIVPNRTIYELLKIKGSSSQHLQQNQSPLFKGTSPLKSYAGITSKHQEHQTKFLKQYPLRSMSLSVITPPEQNYCNRIRKVSHVYSCSPEVTVKCKDTHLDFEEKYRTNMRSINAKDKYFTDRRINAKFRKREEGEHGKQVTKVKSCLRKKDSVSRSRRLRVSFVLPVKDDEQQMSTTESSSEFPGFFVG